MICETCKGEFSLENFDVCPYCLTSFTQKVDCQVVSVLNQCNDLSLDSKCYVSFNKIQTEEDLNDFSENILSDSLDELEITKGEFPSVEVYIDDILDFGTRSRNVLRRNMIFTILELVEFLKENRVEELRNAGVLTAEEIKSVLAKYNSGTLEISKKSEKLIIDTSSNYIFETIHIENEKLPIKAAVALGLSPQTIGVLTKNKLNCMGDLKRIELSCIEKLIGKRNVPKFQNLSYELQKSTKTILEEILTKKINSREYWVYMQRANGNTLQGVADNLKKVANIEITRERIRQIEAKFLNEIKDFVCIIVSEMVRNDQYLDIQDIIDLYDNDDFDRLMIYTCKLMVDQFEYLDFADIFILKKSEFSEEEKLLNFAREFVGDGIDIYENLENLEVLLNNNNFGYIGIGEFINLLKKNRYRFYRNFVVHGNQSYALLCKNLIVKHFPNGIKITQNDSDEGGDLTRLRELVYQEYGDISLPPSDRALSARLSDFMILCDRGKIIPEENILLEESVLEEVKNSIDNNPTDKIFYAELFAEFEGVLKVTSNICNYNFLHGVLMLYYPHEYNYTRDYLYKTQIESEKRTGTIADRLFDYINEVGSPVSKAEIKKKFLGFSDVMLFNPFVIDMRLIQWGYNCYSSMSLVDCNDNDKVELKRILEKVLLENNDYSSDLMYFKAVSNEYSLFITKNNIESPLSLFYIANRLFNDICDFRRPHISNKGKFNCCSMKDIVIHLMGYPSVLSYSEYNQISEKMNWSPITTGIVFSSLEQDFYRISYDNYIKKDEVFISEQDISIIQKIVLERIEEDILSITEFDDFSLLPNIGYEWNHFILGTILENLCSNVKVVYPVIKDRRYQKGIVVRSNCGLNSYSEIVANLMIRNGIETIAENEFLSLLTIHGLAKKVIPKELMNSEFVKFENEKYAVVV